jgi:hypothetical protein
MDIQTIKDRLSQVFKDYIVLGSRPSHLIIGGMIVLGALINCFFAHGWTVWPFVLAFGILTYINEAVARNGQGIPPVQVYGLFIGVGLAWVLIILLLWSISPIIFVLGIAVIFYRVIEAIVRQRERERLIASRRMAGVCLHCGEVYDPNSSVCQSCWEEPNPDAALLKRVAQICRSPQDMARARAVLTKNAGGGASGGGSASSKEKALIDRHHGKKTSHSSPLPKAAKVGPQWQGKKGR